MAKTEIARYQSGVKVTLFCGCAITSEIRMHLKYSIQWKHALIMKDQSPPPLIEITYRGSSYIGLPLEDGKVTLEQVQAMEHEIKRRLSTLCPEVDMTKVHASLLPQVLIA